MAVFIISFSTHTCAVKAIQPWGDCIIAVGHMSLLLLLRKAGSWGNSVFLLKALWSLEGIRPCCRNPSPQSKSWYVLMDEIPFRFLCDLFHSNYNSLYKEGDFELSSSIMWSGLLPSTWMHIFPSTISCNMFAETESLTFAMEGDPFLDIQGSKLYCVQWCELSSEVNCIPCTQEKEHGPQRCQHPSKLHAVQFQQECLQQLLHLDVAPSLLLPLEGASLGAASFPSVEAPSAAISDRKNKHIRPNDTFNVMTLRVQS